VSELQRRISCGSGDAHESTILFWHTTGSTRLSTTQRTMPNWSGNSTTFS
jgi:hypothetical protein